MNSTQGVMADFFECIANALAEAQTVCGKTFNHESSLIVFMGVFDLELRDYPDEVDSAPDSSVMTTKQQFLDKGVTLTLGTEITYKGGGTKETTNVLR
jgi:hypothetical protein